MYIFRNSIHTENIVTNNTTKNLSKFSNLKRNTNIVECSLTTSWLWQNICTIFQQILVKYTLLQGLEICWFIFTYNLHFNTFFFKFNYDLCLNLIFHKNLAILFWIRDYNEIQSSTRYFLSSYASEIHKMNQESYPYVINCESRMLKK